jgi:ABC-type transport system substrate-binding protein
MLRNKLTLAEAERRIASQMPQEEKQKYADYLIDTSDGFEPTRTRTVEVFNELRNTDETNRTHLLVAAGAVSDAQRVFQARRRRRITARRGAADAGVSLERRRAAANVRSRFRRRAAPDTDAVRALFEGLTDYDPQTLTPVPAVATRWESSADGASGLFTCATMRVGPTAIA